jgi:hypothetical protein
MLKVQLNAREIKYWNNPFDQFKFSILYDGSIKRTGDVDGADFIHIINVYDSLYALPMNVEK